ncbi:hypothetical protein M409DRAFT_67601 [Zasmidium cellare ATCC 36951]|uniref:HTH APSES-type domain-containing protein n=1 Tax=Zasmidium cellare ATCC 36951 TaxID=1080233 RepID=A0A6A6CF59_ZASCE|nr:uncharacterized protein M409DRAFT_67601 [Zasmidium cellare ATCC 36951]KAF2164890.1 hypothetical protein M409DRAFT_67601 [Zasmidium cellare ATCC 36951]
MSRPTLPEPRNPLLEEERAPSHEILVERRCLGQTELKVKPGQVNTSNATKLENLGVLDYAHLRVPLPKDLTGSGIFMKGANRKWPEAYFLMRRSSDGFISATGMFKAAFPYSQVEEEQAEKDYIKSLREASSEEIAGNVWIDPGKALELADEYGIKLWIAALLDPEPITHGATDPNKSIKSPPPYEIKEMANGVGRSPEKPSPAKSNAGRRSTRGARSMRSESPTMEKPKTTPRKIATPRKPRGRRAATLEPVNEDGSVTGDAVNGSKEDTVKIDIENTTFPDEKGEEQVESTKVNITMPSNHPDMPIPNDSAEMLQKAKETVMEARKLDGTAPRTRKGKRKAEAMVDEDDKVGLEGPSIARPAKRQRAAEIELRKEKIRRRALGGIAVSLAIGYLIPTVMTTFGLQ